jgi:hypothetical protein
MNLKSYPTKAALQNGLRDEIAHVPSRNQRIFSAAEGMTVLGVFWFSLWLLLSTFWQPQTSNLPLNPPPSGGLTRLQAQGTPHNLQKTGGKNTLKTYGAYSNEVQVTPAADAGVGTVTNLAALAGNNSVQLTWNAVAGAAGYEVERKQTSMAFQVIASNVVNATYIDSASTTAPINGAPQNGSSYVYRVRAFTGS